MTEMTIDVQSQPNYFQELYKIDVMPYLEKKGQFSYLSWSHAERLLYERHPDAKVETKRFNGMPYLETPYGFFVEVAITINGYEKSEMLPVYDNRYNVIMHNDLDAADILNSIQRCKVKALARHGLGLKVYEGELNVSEKVVNNQKPRQSTTAAPAQTQLINRSQLESSISQIIADRHKNGETMDKLQQICFTGCRKQFQTYDQLSAQELNQVYTVLTAS